MASQLDMFASQQQHGVEEDNPGNEAPRLSSTCPPRLNMWKWVVLFDRDETVSSPFLVHSVCRFGNEIKDSWTKSILSSSSRKKTIQLSALDNKTVSLFAKIESSKFCKKTKKTVLL